ncbi:Na-translocating system protein MpsC family protein [Oceanobacillus halophilus]|uniref:Na-translocating system protein MpsC family protein n=1 Tax=Oceanobacillus halophilus TaxID=930130 RepID=UPI001F4E2EDE|nr:Na-translocating system protein MpsC family protein [Oceanobacillus halophilus]
MDQNILNSISSYTSKLLRKNFGKGPKSCQTTVNHKFVVLYIRGFISPMEEVLISQGQTNQVTKARNVIINQVLEELTGVIQVSLNSEVEYYYHDWNFPNNTGNIIYVLNEEIRNENINSMIDNSLLEQEVARISELVQKVPDNINIYPVSSTIYLVGRIGILVPIEKALINKGFKDELLFTKDSLEKSYFHRYGKFKDIFKSDIKDIFIDWNTKEDKSLMAFILGN